MYAGFRPTAAQLKVCPSPTHDRTKLRFARALASGEWIVFRFARALASGERIGFRLARALASGEPMDTQRPRANISRKPRAGHERVQYDLYLDCPAAGTKVNKRRSDDGQIGLYCLSHRTEREYRAPLRHSVHCSTYPTIST
jgi:hypothetical protein